jgi:CDGSH-type Zn-finger protein
VAREPIRERTSITKVTHAAENFMDKEVVITPIEVAVECAKTYWWCACGLSAKQTFCDGSHRSTSFTPIQYRANETGTKWFCVCKRTQTPSFCDGSHNNLGEVND